MSQIYIIYKCRIINVIYFFLRELGQFVSFRRFVPFFKLVEFMQLEFFIVFPYHPFSVSRFGNDIHSLILDICNLCHSFIFLEINIYIAFGLINFSLNFFVLDCTDFCFYLCFLPCSCFGSNFSSFFQFLKVKFRSFPSFHPIQNTF